METPTKPVINHIGRKITRIRELRGIKQETLATELNVSQSTVSRIEQSETIEDDVLEKIATVLGVSSDAIKGFNDETAIYNIQNNYEGSNNGASNVGPAYYMNYQCTFNPLEKLMEAIEENKRLYNEKVALLERLLQSEKEKNELLKNGK